MAGSPSPTRVRAAVGCPGAGAGRHPHVQFAAATGLAGRTPTLTELADYQYGHVHGQVAKAVAEDLAGGGIDC